MTSDGLTVTCKSDYMDVSLSRLEYPWLEPSLLDINLIQSQCTTFNITDMEIRIQAPLHRCGTRTLRKNKYVLEFRNIVMTRPKRPRGLRITYLPDIHFPFGCVYEMTQSNGKSELKSIGKDSRY